MRFLAVAMLVLGVSACGTHEAAAPPSSVQESFARLKQAVRSDDPRGFCELVFPYGRDLPTSGLKELRSLRTPQGQARYEKYLNTCQHQMTAKDVDEWKPVLGLLSIVDVRTNGDIATAQARAKTGRIIPIQFVNAAGGWRLLFRFA